MLLTDAREISVSLGSDVPKVDQVSIDAKQRNALVHKAAKALKDRRVALKGGIDIRLRGNDAIQRAKGWI